MLGAVSDDIIVGTAAVIPDDDVPCGVTLARLYVDPTCWRQGIASVLHDQAAQVAAHRGAHGLNLWVLEDNHTARSMYERRGWRLIAGRTRGNDTPGVVDVLYQLARGDRLPGTRPSTRAYPTIIQAARVSCPLYARIDSIAECSFDLDR